MSSARALKKVPDERQVAFDVSLVHAAARGDRDAFGALIEATQHRLFKFCLYLSGDRIVAEDLCQESYLRAYGRLRDLTKAEAFLDWIFRIAKNLFIDQVRSGRSRETELTEDQLASLGVEDSDLSEIIAVHKSLSQFEPEDRYLLLLVDCEGRTYREAADMMEISEDAVRSRLFRLRQEFLKNWNKP